MFLPYKVIGDEISVAWKFQNPINHKDLEINGGVCLPAIGDDWNPEMGIEVNAKIVAQKSWNTIIREVLGEKGSAKIFIEFLSPGNGSRRLICTFDPEFKMIGNELTLDESITCTISRANICRVVAVRMLIVSKKVDVGDGLATDKVGTILFESRSQNLTVFGCGSRIETFIDNPPNEKLPKIWWELNFDDPMYQGFSSETVQKPVVIHINSNELVDLWGKELTPDIRSHMADFIVDVMIRCIHLAGPEWGRFVLEYKAIGNDRDYDDGSIMEKVLLWHAKVMKYSTSRTGRSGFDVLNYPNLLRNIVYEMMSERIW